MRSLLPLMQQVLFPATLCLIFIVRPSFAFVLPQATANRAHTTLQTLLFSEASPMSNHKNNDDSISRRHVLATGAAAGLAAVSLTIPTAAHAQDDVTIHASWSAADGSVNSLQDEQKFVAFDMSAYKAMKDDPNRTPYFRQAIEERLAKSSSQVVLDMGTGPFALFAIIAAELGAEKVYAIEANAGAAASARYLVQKSGWSDIITVVEGFSNDVELPEKVDFCVAEICGSVATEEGAYATIRDAAARFLKEPELDSSWIPCRIQTYAAPASYNLHNLFGPPEFDWAKLAEPVRFNCRDDGLQLLADPVLVEDVNFADILKTKSASVVQKKVSYTIDSKRIEDNYKPLYDEFRRGNSSPDDSKQLATTTSSSLSGIALWPRLVLSDTIVVNSRAYPSGDHQRSHWQTVLPIMANRPVKGLKGGETVEVNFDFDVPTQVLKACKYSIDGKVKF